MFGLQDLVGDFVNLGFDFIRQDWMSDEADAARNFSAAQAGLQRDWQKEMRATQYQTAVEDMQKAGLNPMLAYSQGGAGTPTGSAAQASLAHPGGTSAYFSGATAAQIRMMDAQADKFSAEAEGERRRYATYDITPERIRQEITESAQRIEQLQEQIRLMQQQKETSAASAEQMRALTDKARAEIPNIRQNLELLKAQTVESLMKAGLDKARAEEVMQKIRANLPQLQRALGVMELNERSVMLPVKEVEAAAKDSFLGAFGMYLDHIKPLASVFGAAVGYGLGRAAGGVADKARRSSSGFIRGAPRTPSGEARGASSRVVND